MCDECHEEVVHHDHEDEVLSFVQFLRRMGAPVPIFMGRPPTVMEESLVERNLEQR